MERKKISMYFRSLLVSFESIIDFTKKIPSLDSLIASIVLDDSFGIKLHLLNFLMKYEKLGEYKVEYNENWAMQVRVTPF